MCKVAFAERNPFAAPQCMNSARYKLARWPARELFVRFAWFCVDAANPTGNRELSQDDATAAGPRARAGACRGSR
jgi:hypothetical protein